MAKKSVDQVFDLMAEHWGELDQERIDRVLKFYELMELENRRQNLTRLIEPEDFVFGHVLDVKNLWESDFMTFPAMDLGSGSGVPGLLFALIEPDSEWILTESEGRKAEFLRRCIAEIGVSNAKVFPDRGEKYLELGSVESVVARGVGPIIRILSWLKKCSTWNKLVLLKGPAWEDERKKLEKKKGLMQGVEILRNHEYSIPPEDAYRVIIEVGRQK